MEPLLNSLIYRIAYLIKPGVNIAIHEPKRNNTVVRKIVITDLVILLLFCCIMVAAIGFNNQFSLGTVKVCNIGADWLLATEPKGMSAQKFVPQLIFPRGRIGAKFTGTLYLRQMNRILSKQPQVPPEERFGKQ